MIRSGVISIMLWGLAVVCTAQQPAVSEHNVLAFEQRDAVSNSLALGNAERGRLVFAPCRTCHARQPAMGHKNGPNLHRIFGKIAGKQTGFEYYSDTFKQAQFVWTPQLMYAWLEDPLGMFPESSMMSAGVKSAQQRADLISYLLQVTAGD